jgi:signal transduction histidine kinase
MKILKDIKEHLIDLSFWFLNPERKRVISKEIYLNYMVLALGSLALLSLIFNTIVGLELNIIIALFILIGILPIWLINKYSKNNTLAQFIGYPWFIVLYNVMYFSNNGSMGPTNYYLFITIFAIVYFNKKLYSYLLFGLFLINILINGLIEYSVPGIVSPYNSKITQFLDNLFGLVSGIGVIILLLRNIIKLQIKEKDIANESNRLKTSFLANTSHDIRSPINSILGFSDLLADPNLSNSDKKRYIGIIHANSDQLLNLVDDIFNISIIESGDFELHNQFTEINSIILDLYTNFNLMIKNSEKKIILQAYYGLPETLNIVYIDPVRIKQILTNLIQNAIKHTESGAIIFGYDKPVDIQELQFYVRDTGMGMPQDQLENIFEPYVTNIEQDKKSTGIGLGLHISKKIVEIANGKIWATSKLGEGSQFYFTIPLEK